MRQKHLTEFIGRLHRKGVCLRFSEQANW
jgi:hypothetical protein